MILPGSLPSRLASPCPPDLDYARRFLLKESTEAYEFALESLGGPSYLADCPYEILPIGDPDVLSNSTFYQELFKDEPKLRLQHEFAKSIPELSN